MPSPEELAAAERAIRDFLARGAEAELRAIPGVVHVSVGLRERGGAVENEPVIRVYVLEKKPLDTLAPAERVPPEIGGVPIDVNVVERGGAVQNLTSYRPVRGGIAITNGILYEDPATHQPMVGYGTLGCIATYNPDQSAVLLSCWHVLFAHAPAIGDPVYQPPSRDWLNVALDTLPRRVSDNGNAIGKLLRHGIANNVDAAIARLDVSSWCNCCGIKSENYVEGLNQGGTPATNNLVGPGTATLAMTVYKSGATTGKTSGRVVDPSAPFILDEPGGPYNIADNIKVEDTDAAHRFSGDGDSGSAVVDGSGHLLGMLFAKPSPHATTTFTYVQKIAAICTELDITIRYTPAGGSAGARVAVPRGAFADADAGAEAYRAVRERLLADPAGAWLLEMAEAHRVEIVNLVTRRRPVTVAWHRAHGPAFLAHALNTLRDGGDALPPPVEGTAFAAALERMRAPLLAHGSDELREAVELHGDALLDAARESATLAEALERLNATLFARV